MNFHFGTLVGTISSEFNAKALRGEAATKVPDSRIKRKERKGARGGRKENSPPRSFAPTFAASALKNPRRTRQCWELALQNGKAGKVGLTTVKEGAPDGHTPASDAPFVGFHLLRAVALKSLPHGFGYGGFAAALCHRSPNLSEGFDGGDS